MKPSSDSASSSAVRPSRWTTAVAAAGILLALALAVGGVALHLYGERWFDEALVNSDMAAAGFLLKLRPGLANGARLDRELRKKPGYFNDLAVRFLIENGARLEKNHDEIAMRFAAVFNAYNIINKMIESGVSPDTGEPLAYASLHGQEQMVDFLLKKGADPNKKTNYLPIWEYYYKGYPQGECFFGEYIFSADTTCLHLASNHVIIESLLKAGADVELSDTKSHAPLRHNFLNQNESYTRRELRYRVDEVRALLKGRANPNVIDKRKNTLLHLIGQSIEVRFQRCLKRDGSTDKFLSPWFIGEENAALAALLLEHGADPELKNDAGQTFADTLSDASARDLFLNMVAEARASLAAQGEGSSARP